MVPMTMRKGQIYRCQNKHCGAELQVERESTGGFANPICCCGAEMTTRYDAPALAKLECSPEVIVLLKLLAELNGFELIDRGAAGVRPEPSDSRTMTEHFLTARRALGLLTEAACPLPLERVRDLYVQRVLELCHGNRARAAQALGIGRNSLYRILKRLRETEDIANDPQVQSSRILETLLSSRT